MKKRIRTFSILITAILTLALMLAFPLSAACAYEGESAENTDGEEIGELTEDGNTEEADTPGGETEADAAQGRGNVFSEIFSLAEKYSAELLSALAFIGSIIIMVCYKMGFLPMVKNGVQALASGVSKLSEHTGNITESSEQLRINIEKKLSATEGVLNKMADTLSMLEVKLSEEGAARDEISALKTVMAGEVDMLYEIFMAAALPQYLKDSVGERIAAMRASLDGEGA